MICIDTTILIDEFRAKGDPNAAVNRRLHEFRKEALIVPIIVAGEFLDGAAMVSIKRFDQGVELLMRRKLVFADFVVAKNYAKAVSSLRRAKALAGRSHNDLWIAATALTYEARLLTRNPAHFSGILGLEVIGYDAPPSAG